MKTRTKGAAWRRLLKWGATAPFLAVSLFLGQAQAQEAEDGYLNLVAYWNFDNGAEIDDDAVITDEVAGIEGLLEGTILSTEGRTGEEGDNAIDLGEEPDGQIIIEAIEDALGIKAIRNYLPMQLGDVPATWADTRLLRELTGFAPSTNFKDGVGDFVDWYRDYRGTA